MRITMIAAAETSFLAQHPDLGYSCALSTLFAPNPLPQDPSGTPLPNPGFFDPGQGNEEYNGYRFVLTGCDGNPATKYRVSAVPSDPDSTLKTFCADESGTVRSLASGTASSCFTRGQVVNRGAASPSIEID
jgi:hypothetical protein